MAGGRKGVVGNLPAELTSFVGRRSELAEIKRALSSSRLVTLVGPGGVGKTRLALHSAAALRRAFPDGVWFVDVSSLRDEELLASTIALALDLQSRSTKWAPAALSRHLATRSMLLILDNCEYLAYACAVMVDTLLKRCPDLHVLVTSRQPLAVAGERLITVTPLSAPDPTRLQLSPVIINQFDAVALFSERAQAAEPRFRITEDNAGAVADLCYQLDGLPLAVELAAARARHFSPQQILNRLDENYGLLDSGSTTTAPRQRSVQGLIGWSHDLCSPAERLLWARLSVFAGSFTAEAAETVCSDGDLPRDTVLATLAGLVDKSIVLTDLDESEVRYRMLTTIRAFGREHLVDQGEASAVRTRHLDYFLDAAAALYSQWFGPDQTAIMSWMRTERDNLRAALDFALTEPSHAESSGQLATTLGGEALLRGVIAEGRHWIDRSLAVLEKSSPTRSTLQWVSGVLVLWQGDPDTAEAMLNDARSTAEQLDDRHGFNMATTHLGICHLRRGRFRDSIELFDQVLELPEGPEDAMCRAIVSVRRGASTYQLGDPERGIALCREAIAISDAHGELWHKGEALWELSNILWHEGDLESSRALAREALRIQRLFRHAVGTAHCFEILAWIASADGDHARAARLLGAADVLWETTDAQLFPYLTGQKDSCVQRTRSTLGARAYDESHRQGARSSTDDNVAFALDESVVRRQPEAEDEPQLTKRELEIAELVATGASNKDIAVRLVTSPRTIESHVAHILTKLGFNSRAQIASWVAAQQALTRRSSS